MEFLFYNINNFEKESRNLHCLWSVTLMRSEVFSCSEKKYQPSRLVMQGRKLAEQYSMAFILCNDVQSHDHTLWILESTFVLTFLSQTLQPFFMFLSSSQNKHSISFNSAKTLHRFLHPGTKQHCHVLLISDTILITGDEMVSKYC